MNFKTWKLKISFSNRKTILPFIKKDSISRYHQFWIYFPSVTRITFSTDDDSGLEWKMIILSLLSYLKYLFNRMLFYAGRF